MTTPDSETAIRETLQVCNCLLDLANRVKTLADTPGLHNQQQFELQMTAQNLIRMRRRLRDLIIH